MIPTGSNDAEQPRKISLLIENRCEPDAQDLYGLTPLHYAAIKGYSKNIIALLKGGADVNKDVIGYTPLFYMALNSNTKNNNILTNQYIKVIRSLLKKNANVNIRPADKLYAHYYFALQGNDTAVRLLLEAGAQKIEYSLTSEYQQASKKIERIEKGVRKKFLYHFFSEILPATANVVINSYLETPKTFTS